MIRVPFDGKGSSDDVSKGFSTQDNRLLSIASIQLANSPPEQWTLECSDGGNTITLTRELPVATIKISAQFQPSDPASERAAKLEVRHEYILKEQEESDEPDANGESAAKQDPTTEVKNETQKLKDIKVLVTTQLHSAQRQLLIELARFKIQFD